MCGDTCKRAPFGYTRPVNTESLLRLIELVRRELGADDARLELGGRDPDDPRLLFRMLPNGFRVVAVFAEAPVQRELLEEKLRLLLVSFAGIGNEIGDSPTSYRPPAQAQHDLDEELAILVERSEATRALVIDDRSPMVWGSSELPRGVEDIAAMTLAADTADRAEELGLDLAELLGLPEDEALRRVREKGPERTTGRLSHGISHLRRQSERVGADAWRAHLAAARAVRAVRAVGDHGPRLLARAPGLHFVSRAFAAIYRLVLVFDGDFSELHAEAAAVRALPTVEKLVLSVPPIEPPPSRGKVIKWRGPGGGG